MGFFSSLFKDALDEWMESATDEELEEGYEERRLEWLADGGGEKTPEMERIGDEITRRAGEKWEKDPRRNTDPNFRWTDENRWD